MCKIAILENYSLFCSGISPVLNNHPDFEVILEEKSINDLLLGLSENRPDIIIIDVVHCEKEGITPIKKIRRKLKRTPILLVVSNEYADYFEDYISLGINGIVFNNSEVNDLIMAVKALKNSEDFFPQRVWLLLKNFLRRRKKDLVLDLNNQILSNREISILKLFCKGFTYKEIGANLNISPRTVETHKKNIQSKIGVRSTAEMVEYAFQNNLHQI